MNRYLSARSPDISVVMSCYNASAWLHEAISSVLAQTFDNFELILVDDGSTDDTWPIIQSYQRRDVRIIALSKANSGLADSLNTGISNAKGTWVARLDSDDLSSPTRLAQQFDYVRTHPEIVLVGTGFFAVDEHDRIVKAYRYPVSHSKLLRNLENVRRFFPHSSAMFHKKIAVEDGGYNPLYRKGQDWDLWFRLAEKGLIACLGDHLVLVRSHPAQISNSPSGPSQLVYATVAATCHFLRLNGCQDPSRRTTVPAWEEFVTWVSGRMTEEGIFGRRGARKEARDQLFSTNNRLTGAVKSASVLVESGQALSLLKEALVGFSLPRELAREWSADRKQTRECDGTEARLT